MNNNQNQIKILEEKLEALLNKQEGFAKELMELYKEIDLLKKEGIVQNNAPFATQESVSPDNIEEPIRVNQPISSFDQVVEKTSIPQKSIEPVFQKPKAPKGKSNLEKFIGENLINKIGILITIFGVIIGAKYSIENNLISPLTRIILGYITGLVLLVFGIKLKTKYLNYSAVLVSGAIAILYFITFAAYSLYDLFPQLLAFILMVVFTVFAVVASLNYNKQIIAHIGLVGAYAVPFLLSTGSGDVFTLFSYMAIINIGILRVAFKKYWKPLYYVSFVFTWLIYYSWLLLSYRQESHFTIALSFLTLFFVIFYLAFMGYKLIKKEQFNSGDIVIVFSNSIIFYAFGYYLLSGHETGKELLGLFTLANAVIHFIVATIIYKQKLADKKILYLIAALVLTFITVAIPVQLDGNWVTILWAVEAAVLFWFGITKGIKIYKKLAYILMILAFFSIFQDWSWVYDTYSNSDPDTKLTPFLNINFLSSMLVVIAFGFIAWFNYNKKYATENRQRTRLDRLTTIIIPVLFLIIAYFSIAMEIDAYWNQLFKDSSLSLPEENNFTFTKYNHDINDFKIMWLLNYTLLFFTTLSFINITKIKNRLLGTVNLLFNPILVFAFLTLGLYTLSELRSSYIKQTLAEYYEIGLFNLGIRYISFIFLGFILFAIHKYIKQPFMKSKLKIAFELFLHFTCIWILSSELLHWIDIAGNSNSYKMNLSMLWGTYSLLLVIIGIWKRKKYLRIGGISLFGITLIKLFFYDIVDLDTISKTIVLVSLGLLLLVISFLYNKYTKQIENDPKNE
tara:strand:+ start:192296 stop:194674 length:2379 start_codon:yes stop_codon:yes gene_type:complete